MTVYSNIFMLIVGIFLVTISCKSTHELTVVDHFALHPVTVIVDNGIDSNYSFGAISDVEHLSNGNIAVLDRITAKAFVFSHDGQYLYNIGNKGEGPGELINPDCMVSVSPNSLLIFDVSKGCVIRYGEDGSYISEEYINENMTFPKRPIIRGNDSFVGGVLNFVPSGDSYIVDYSICVLSSEFIVEDTLFSKQSSYAPDDITGILRNTVFSCAYSADKFSNVFIAPVSDEVYEIMGYNSNGDIFFETNQSYERVKKNEEEIALEAERYNCMLRARNPGNTQNYNPPEYRDMIAPQGLHTDNLDRVWVLRGTRMQPVFDVYQYSGEHLFSIDMLGMNSEDTSDILWWSISEHGILAFSVDPYDSPRVYVYDLP